MRRPRRPPRPGAARRQLLASLCVGLILGLLAIYTINARLRPAVAVIVSDHLSNQISDEVCGVVDAILEEEGITYDIICTIQYGASGEIVALQTDMAKLTMLQNAITTQVAEAFDDSLISEQVQIPLGSLLPGLTFSGRGPTVTVEVLTVGDISAEFENEFFSEGINQTLHRVVLTVTADLSLLLPGGVYTYTDVTQVVLAETVLLGQVPDSYFTSAESAEDAYYYDNANGE